MKYCLMLLCLMLSCCERNDSASGHRLYDPNPEFCRIFSCAEKLEFVSSTIPGSELLNIKVDAAEEVASFFESLKFDAYPNGEITHCMCVGDPNVIVTMNDGSTKEFTLHHGVSIRCDAFGSDLMLTEDSIKLLGEFLGRHGIQSQ